MGTGITEVASSGSLTISSANVYLQRTIDNKGKVFWGDADIAVSGSTNINNKSGARFEITAGQVMSLAGTGDFKNDAGATLLKSGGGISQIYLNYPNNPGLVDVKVGLELQWKGATKPFQKMGGLLQIESGATMTVFGEFDQEDGDTIIQGGTLAVIGTAEIAGGRVTVQPGTVSVDGEFDQDGGTVFMDTGMLTASGDIWVNGGTMEAVDDSSIFSETLVEIASGGTFIGATLFINVASGYGTFVNRHFRK